MSENSIAFQRNHLPSVPVPIPVALIIVTDASSALAALSVHTVAPISSVEDFWEKRDGSKKDTPGEPIMSSRLENVRMSSPGLVRSTPSAINWGIVPNRFEASKERVKELFFDPSARRLAVQPIGAALSLARILPAGPLP